MSLYTCIRVDDTVGFVIPRKSGDYIIAHGREVRSVNLETQSMEVTLKNIVRVQVHESLKHPCLLFIPVDFVWGREWNTKPF